MKESRQTTIGRNNDRALGERGEKCGIHGRNGSRRASAPDNAMCLSRVVVLEFPSLEQARAFYDSPEYVAARAVREGAAQMNLVAVEGV
ncbi:MAG: DUF1330 domain-containing protein [Betaproteobacteria bacterium]|nr:MAG: DUF1330 domain-containing protein [Betaproteobacteria bacterium]